MATAIKGSVSLTYGAHTQSETFSTTASTLTNANEHHNYSAGGGRALVAGGALDVGTIGAAEGLLIIKNDNTYGALSISMDTSAYDISIPAGLVNLISVGPDHAVYVKCPTATESGILVATVTAAGAITFGSGGAIGTAIMTGVANVNGNTNDYLVEFSASGVGTVFDLDGVTKKDLTADYDLANNSTVNLVYNVRYRYTLTEA